MVHWVSHWQDIRDCHYVTYGVNSRMNKLLLISSGKKSGLTECEGVMWVFLHG